MITRAAGLSGCKQKACLGPTLLTDDEIAAIAGGIVIVPKSPPLGWTPEPQPAPPPHGGATP
jgi:hypothetical protein